jgi:hypothetical protein
LYQRYDPQKVVQVQSMLGKHVGQEEKLLSREKWKYKKTEHRII